MHLIWLRSTPLILASAQNTAEVNGSIALRTYKRELVYALSCHASLLFLHIQDWTIESPSTDGAYGTS